MFRISLLRIRPGVYSSVVLHVCPVYRARASKICFRRAKGVSMQLSRSSNRFLTLIVVLLGVASFTSAAIIAPTPPNFQILMQVGTGAPYGLGATVTPVQDGDKWKYQIDGSYNQHGYQMTLHYVIDPDPKITGNAEITNLTQTT